MKILNLLAESILHYRRAYWNSINYAESQIGLATKYFNYFLMNFCNKKK